MFATAVRFFVILSQLVVQASRYGLGLLGYTLVVPLLGRDACLARKQRLKARCLAALFRNLQATFIKIGQVLSTRRDLLPGYVIEELETLQDRVPELPFRRIRQVIEQDLGRPVEQLFAQLSRRPVAAGSIAQVHEGCCPAESGWRSKSSGPRSTGSSRVT
jgi:predicted unusual protein kinase regulating ubiquinone biosynthesis (AarF/ABC1/UbiB family)